MAAISGIGVRPLPRPSFAPKESCFRASAISSGLKINGSSEEPQSIQKATIRRRALLGGVGLLFTGTSSGTFAFADEVPENYQAFVDFSDGYSYYYPSEWREFDFRGHDSAFKDRTLPLQNVRVSFKPTDKTDVRDLGPMEERSIDGKNYWTFEYEIASSGFSRASFATIAIGNGKCYTLIVGANERRWRKLKDRLRVVADSFKIFDV
ncbi:photosynthetic NDH subunit of lumenal location 1, chloroplastic [Nymphaea colorata]|uniref:photosynthetic NDH subunit of lumenal location 1, chloroplastic n=1 Tax=Nymphaea colorata TaxID=210225 RepID=UPI00129EC4F7|nr:photosynthetic NDH subunit of lumenal location 1, chloroplastic [Nymphaea colorata]